MITESFVLMSPSTVIRLKLCATASERAFQQAWLNRRIAGDECKHGGVICGHARLNHARAFANSANAHGHFPVS